MGFLVEAHDDHFAQNTPDTEWIPIVANKRWIVITNDKNIARNSLEIDAHMTACGRAIMPHGRMGPSELGELLGRTREKLLSFLNRAEKSGKKSFMAKIRSDMKRPDGSGCIDIWIDEEAWLKKVQKRTR